MTRFARGSSDSEPPSIRARRPRIAGELAAEGGQVDAEPAEGLGGDAVVRLDERGEEVLGVEDRLLQLSALRWAARIASWAFWVYRSSCMGLSGSVDPGLGQAVAVGWSVCSGSGWSMIVETARAASAASPSQRRRQDDAGPGERSPVALAAEAGHALALEAEALAVLGAGRDLQEDPALERRDRHLAAEQSLAEGDRQLALRSAPFRVNTGCGRTRIRTTRSPPPRPWPVSLTLSRSSTPRGIVTSSRLPSISTRRVVPW